MRLSFQIVESHRIDGKPRQKVIEHVGSLEQQEIDAHDVVAFAHFWNRAYFRFTRFSEAEQSRLISQLEKHVPRPAQSEVDAAVERQDQEFREAERQFAKALGRSAH